jgi:hypothetical protein
MALQTFCEALAVVQKPGEFLSLGFLEAVLINFGLFEPRNQLFALKMIGACCSMPGVEHRLARALCVFVPTLTTTSPLKK